MTTRDYSYLTAGARALLFVDHTSAAVDEKLRSKARLWENVLRENVHTSMVDSYKLLEIDSLPRHINWVTAEVAAERLIAILSTF